MQGEDDGTWESLLPGDCERPAVRMYWPNVKVDSMPPESQRKPEAPCREQEALLGIESHGLFCLLFYR
jgi:hypothetical protein